MPDLSAWWNPCEILALRRHPRLCLLMPMALWIFTLALKSCIKLSHLFCSGPLLRPEVQNLGFDYPCFIYRSYSLIFLVLYQSLEPDFQALESNSDGLIILPSVRSHTEPGPEWGVDACCWVCLLWAMGSRKRNSSFQKQTKSVLHTDGTGMTRSQLFSFFPPMGGQGSQDQAACTENCSALFCVALMSTHPCLFHMKCWSYCNLLSLSFFRVVSRTPIHVSYTSGSHFFSSPSALSYSEFEILSD